MWNWYGVNVLLSTSHNDNDSLILKASELHWRFIRGFVIPNFSIFFFLSCSKKSNLIIAKNHFISYYSFSLKLIGVNKTLKGIFAHLSFINCFHRCWSNFVIQCWDITFQYSRIIIVLEFTGDFHSVCDNRWCSLKMNMKDYMSLFVLIQH